MFLLRARYRRSAMGDRALVLILFVNQLILKCRSAGPRSPWPEAVCRKVLRQGGIGKYQRSYQGDIIAQLWLDDAHASRLHLESRLGDGVAGRTQHALAFGGGDAAS